VRGKDKEEPSGRVIAGGGIRNAWQRFRGNK